MAENYRSLPQISEQDEARFWSQVAVGQRDECWLWLASVNPKRGSYGRFWIRRAEYRANRVAYYLHYNQDPKELSVCHKCDNPRCCNPYHYFLGTAADNLADMKAKGRNPKGEKCGRHKLTLAQVREVKRRYGREKISQAALGREYGVGGAAIGLIVRGVNWRDID